MKPASEIRACKSHSEAERRRRQRINGHLATLRTLLPSAARMDKATLLGEVVRHVRELRGLASDVAGDAPGEGDEVGVEDSEGCSEGLGLLRGSAWSDGRVEPGYWVCSGQSGSSRDRYDRWSNQEHGRARDGWIRCGWIGSDSSPGCP
ncbi:hypothetical protein J5N97_000821 [Dioscorea zingiberensis]|uniref:BHLH domain-containing protein n=1 Tax=Dioscorea zingiberensis TaxID=325984 RepID=A0A9D5BUK9_9LILI|nr:hypothetical protein J5N97_000821 [Dioscorea zingiberensis]